MRTSVGNGAAAGGLAACFLPLNQSALASCVALRCLSGAPVPPHTGPAASPSDIHGVHKATVARGEDDFPSARLRVRGCLLACRTAAVAWTEVALRCGLLASHSVAAACRNAYQPERLLSCLPASCPLPAAQILDCHDAVMYALAPLQYVLITACSDCVIVLGAVGRCLRVERCERVQVGAGEGPGGCMQCIALSMQHSRHVVRGLRQRQ